MHQTSKLSVSRGQRRTGRIISALPALFLAIDAIAKLFRVNPAIEGTVRLGYDEQVVVPLGILLSACIIVYAIRRTALLGAILLTGYLGGAVATHVRAGGPPFSVLFPVILGAMLWGGLWLRDGRLRTLLPLIAAADH